MIKVLHGSRTCPVIWLHYSDIDLLIVMVVGNSLRGGRVHFSPYICKHSLIPMYYNAFALHMGADQGGYRAVC